MRNKLVALVAFLLTAGFAFSNEQLSEKAKISVITCAPGNLIYECFGHTAIRVHDPARKGFDYVFNYGIFEFNKPNFELNFALGYMEYKLGVQEFNSFKRVYTKDNRTIKEQILNLNSQQKQEFFDFLVWNEKRENRYYMYDYFDDNCATKVRVVIEDEVGLDIDYNTNFKETQAFTYRDLIDSFAHNNRWAQLGIDLCLGVKIDKVLDDREYDFLPAYLYKTLKSAEFNNKPLVQEEAVIHKGVPRASTPWYLRPVSLFWLFTILAAVFIAFGKKQKPKLIFDAVLYASTGFIGLFLIFLWIGTNHSDAALNLNLIWAMPLNLALPFLPVSKRRKYYLFYALILGFVVVNWFWLPQALNNAFLPIIILMAIRSFAGYFRLCD